MIAKRSKKVAGGCSETETPGTGLCYATDSRLNGPSGPSEFVSRFNRATRILRRRPGLPTVGPMGDRRHVDVSVSIRVARTP